MRAAALALFVLGWVPVFVLRSERFSERRAAEGADVVRWMWITALVVTLHVTLVEVVLTMPGPFTPAGPRVAAGMMVFALGLVIWTLGRRALVDFSRRLDPASTPSALVTTGPFALVRHPLAFGMILLALGPAFAAGTAATWVTFAAVVGALVQRCRQDEHELHAVFGNAYARYAARTARLVPFVW